jgi:hypothetical protein
LLKHRTKSLHETSSNSYRIFRLIHIIILHSEHPTYSLKICFSNHQWNNSTALDNVTKSELFANKRLHPFSQHDIIPDHFCLSFHPTHQHIPFSFQCYSISVVTSLKMTFIQPYHNFESQTCQTLHTPLGNNKTILEFEIPQVCSFCAVPFL